MNNKIAQFPNKVHATQRIKSHNIVTIDNYKARQDKEYDKVAAENDCIVHIVFALIIFPLAAFVLYLMKEVG